MRVSTTRATAGEARRNTLLRPRRDERRSPSSSRRRRCAVAVAGSTPVPKASSLATRARPSMRRPSMRRRVGSPIVLARRGSGGRAFIIRSPSNYGCTKNRPLPAGRRRPPSLFVSITLVSQLLALGESTVHVTSAGSSGRPAVLFLHGWPQDATSWWPILERAAGEVHAFAIDLPGIGRSFEPRADGTKTRLA